MRNTFVEILSDHKNHLRESEDRVATLISLARIEHENGKEIRFNELILEADTLILKIDLESQKFESQYHEQLEGLEKLFV